RVTASPAMEMYRLFMANSGQLSAPLLEAVIHAGVVFGDVMPPPGSLNLHPMTRDILEAILEACQGHRSRIRDAESGRVLRLASRWIKEVCRALLGFMPPREEPEAEGDPELIRKMKEILDNEDLEIPSFMRRRRFPKDPPTLSGEPPERFAPLDDPRPPSLHKPESESERIARSLKDPARDSQNRLETGKSASNMSKKTREVLDSLGKSLEEAAGQPSKAQDMKSEIVAAALFDRPFDEGPIQGEPATGAEVAVDLGDVVGRVEVHDRPISPSNHGETVALLTREARGIAELLQRYIYTNVKRYTEMRRLRTRGSLDPARLAMAGFSNTVYRSFQTRSAGDRQGRPLLVLGIDASASNSSAQIRVGKLLTAAYLMSARRHGVRVLSGIYSSGPIRRGLSGTLIQWLYHPQKTLTHSPADAVRSVAAMPDMGSGAQKDVVSVARILEEARTLARGNRIYLVLITDCEWNVSLHMGKSGFEEVKGFFSEAARKANGSLHTTLVAVGKDAPTDLEDVLDAVIRIPADKLEDVGAVANQLARHVADCIRTHRRGRSGR
ncbi:MAG: hypothetical protein KKA60_04280, partial [Proteobacteria bacterium]|nr:hypothetical protein [Pseudomonadota bacterium]